MGDDGTDLQASSAPEEPKNTLHFFPSDGHALKRRKIGFPYSGRRIGEVGGGPGGLGNVFNYLRLQAPLPGTVV